MDIIQELERFSEEKQISFSKIAKGMGIGSSTLSEVRKGTYSGDREAILNKIESYLERHKEQMRRIDFVAETQVKKKVFLAINMIKKYVASNARNEILGSAKIAYITGRAGIGKTYALREYVKNYGAKSIFITAENSDTANVIIRKIALAMKKDIDRRRIEEIKEEIKTTLKFTETIIIVDESEHLKPKVIDIVRAIADQTGIGLVFAGTEKLRTQILSQRAEYEYLSSRAAVWMGVSELKIGDIDLIVRRFIKPELELYKEEELRAIISYINNAVKGSARILENLLGMAYSIATEPENFSKTGGLLTLSYIKAAESMLVII